MASGATLDLGRHDRQVRGRRPDRRRDRPAVGGQRQERGRDPRLHRGPRLEPGRYRRPEHGRAVGAPLRQVPGRRLSIDSYVSLGTPQYGIYSACLLPARTAARCVRRRRFLRELNRGDDTPGEHRWTTIYSTADEFVSNSSSRLDGGACHVQVSGVGHNDMDNDAGIFAHVLAAVDGTCTARSSRTPGQRPVTVGRLDEEPR